MRSATFFGGLALLLALPLSGCDTVGLDDQPCIQCDADADDGGGDADDGGDLGGPVTTFLEVDPRQTYTRTHGDGALDAPALLLADEGLAPGDRVCATAVGDFRIASGGGLARSRDLPLVTAIFSADDELLAADQFDRVTGAIDVGSDVVTPDTESEGHATDVAQDFDATEVCVTIPDGARYVFLSAYDTYFADNEDVVADGQPFGLVVEF